MEEASEFFGCPIQTFRNVLHFKEILFGYFWSKNDSINIEEFSKGSIKKAVYKYLKSGKLIESYVSISEAAKNNNTKVGNLVTAIQGNSLVDNKYYYSFQLVDIFIPKPKASLKNKTYYVYDLNGTYIKCYKSIKELKEIGIKSYNSI